ncbi:engulfment and cell motility protein 2-like [Lycorma delicatula]|uniref:engulfment and cell motility protein 2-like n=1 Tax=Lycorma delicatula TaxID=130591 RepID=UPI003F513838
MAPNHIVSVAVDVGNSVELFKLNKDEELANTVKILCEQYNITYVENKFSLQFTHDQSGKKFGAKYVTEENKVNIVNGTELKLVYSPSEISRMIYNNLQNNGDICWALEKLAGHIYDPIFALVVFPLCYPVVNQFLKDEKLPSSLLCYCLRALLGFLEFNLIQEVEPSLIKRLINNITSENHVENCLMENSLRILKVCLTKDHYLLITDLIDIEDLTPLLLDRDSPIIQECTLALINATAHYCQNDSKKSDILNKMNSYNSRKMIASNVLYPGAEPNCDLAQQLYLYQIHILSLNLDLLEPFLIDFYKLPDAEIVPEERRHSGFENRASDLFLEFNVESTGTSSRNSRCSKELHANVNTNRISDPGRNEGMYYNRNQLVLSFLNLDINEFDKDTKGIKEMPDVRPINKLIYNCIIYFSKHYRKNYQCSLFVEGCRNFIIICSDVVNLILFDVLHVGDPPIPESTAYIPLVFYASYLQPFMEELFCVTMWLFERTKREMRAKTYDDYKKVIKVMARQLTESLRAQPKLFSELEYILRTFTYSAVYEQWQMEKKAKQQHFIRTSTAVNELRSSLKKELTEIIKNQRINYIMKGSKFPVWDSQRNQKVKDKFWFARLSSHKKHLLYSTNITETENMKTVLIKDVEDFVVGDKCPHLKEFKSRKEKHENPLGFSLIFDKNEGKSLDFITNNKKVYEYWVDALNSLFRRKMKSNMFTEELNKLLDMELRIRLLEIDGIDCPSEPPPIPPLPDNFDFTEPENCVM